MATVDYKPFTPAQRSALQEELEKAAAPVWPTTTRRVSQGVTPTHKAIDIPGNVGDPIYAPLAGKVTDVRPDQRGYGLNVRILLDSGQEVILAHLSGVNVRPGQVVRRGQVIGALGASGKSPGRAPLSPHLHFEVREPGPDRFTPGYSSTTTALDPYEFFGRSPVFRSASAPMSTTWAVQSGSKKTEMPAAEKKWLPQSLGVPPGAQEVLFAAEMRDQPGEGETSLIGTPFGDVTLKPLPWMRIGAVGLGLILVVVAIAAIVKEPVKKGIGVAKKVAPVVIGAVNPAAGVVTGVAAS